VVARDAAGLCAGVIAAPTGRWQSVSADLETIKILEAETLKINLI
jgi:hypothetical protein